MGVVQSTNIAILGTRLYYMRKLDRQIKDLDHQLLKAMQASTADNSDVNDSGERKQSIVSAIQLQSLQSL